jgi:hypothetical protein
MAKEVCTPVAHGESLLQAPRKLFSLAHRPRPVPHYIRHQELGRRPRQPARPGKVVANADVASGKTWRQPSGSTMQQRRPSQIGRLFCIFQQQICLEALVIGLFPGCDSTWKERMRPWP